MTACLAPWAPFTAAAIEGPSLGSVHRTYDLGGGAGVIAATCYELGGVEPIVVAPTQLKKFTGNAAATKADMARYAVSHLGALIDDDDDDAADAAALAALAYAHAGGRKPSTRAEAEVLHSLRRPATRKPRRRRSTTPNV